MRIRVPWWRRVPTGKIGTSDSPAWRSALVWDYNAWEVHPACTGNRPYGKGRLQKRRNFFFLKKGRYQLKAITGKDAKIVLGIPRHLSTEKLLGMDKRNTGEELSREVGAHHSTQRVRVRQTLVSRRVLANLCWQQANHKKTALLRKLWALKVESKPLPQNMRLGRNDGHRTARVRPWPNVKTSRITKCHSGVTLYADAFLRKLTTQDAVLTCPSVKTGLPEEAKQGTAAVALTLPILGKIITCSQTAYGNFR